MTPTDIEFMQHAYDLALHAEHIGEVPIGAVIVKDQKIIGKGFNQSITTNDPTAHAEIVAMRAAGQSLKNYRLADCTLYVTLEPCAMCAYAMIHARIKRLVYSCVDPRTGAAGGIIDLLNMPHWNHQVNSENGPMEAECRHLLQEFFRKRR